MVIHFCFTAASKAQSKTNLPQDESSSVNFNKDIRPILNRHCTACHGGVKQAADISFVYQSSVVAPDGWIVEPGDPENSLLLERVLSGDGDTRMPPPEHGRALNANEIDLLKRWIEQGAQWESHWAFRKPDRPKLPKVKDATWPKSTLDHFVLAKLELEKIQPAPAADPQRWLRRVTLDITGLPPTIKQRSEFLESLQSCQTDHQIEQAYEKVVDELLSSPAYGERWASVWLDQVRYADSKGLGIDGRRNVWKYRDWVITALNADMPFDQFTLKQLAGDLLPQPTIDDFLATTNQRLTQTNEEGGTDDEEFRVAAVLDRVNTTWQTWQGLTFGCVQCHSHPYDPFRHEEYYQFAAFFNNTADSDLGEDWPVVNVPVATSDYETASRLDNEIQTLTSQIWARENEATRLVKWSSLVGLKAQTNNQTKVATVSQPNHDEFHTVDTVSQNTTIILSAPIPKQMKTLTAIQVNALPMNPDSARIDSEWGFSLSNVTASLRLPDQEEPFAIEFAQVLADEPNPFFDPNDSLKPKSNRGFAAYTRIYHPRRAVLVLKSPIDLPADAELQVSLHHRMMALGAFPLVIRRGHLAITDSDTFGDLKTDKGYSGDRNHLSKLREQRKAIKSVPTPVLKERPEHLSRTQHVFVRGLFLTKDKPVQPATPESFHELTTQTQPNRLDMANWLVSSDNPLTARVAVNRIWARLFGVGIVATEEDFGSSGEPPSHPQLLDHLAIHFQQDLKWNQKRLIKLILLSSTYRQSSSIRSDLLERDPQNRLLARGPRHRLSAEVIRDAALSISGLLSEKSFGPPVHPPIPQGVWKPFQGGDKWKTPDTDSPDRYRRSIYTYTKRSIPFPVFAAFDSPSREVCTPRRLRSNTPLQALMSLNDQTMIECAEAFARKMQESDPETISQLENGFLMATCRRPEADELNILKQLLDSYSPQERSLGWRAVAHVLLNLDEVVSK